jgi:hypothetical protein
MQIDAKTIKQIRYFLEQYLWLLDCIEEIIILIDEVENAELTAAMDSYKIKADERWTTLKNGRKVAIKIDGGNIVAGLPDKYHGQPITEVRGKLEAKYDLKQKNKLLKAVDPTYAKEATKLFNEAVSGKGLDTQKKVSFRKIDYTEAQRLKRHTGLDLEGYEHTVSNKDFKHIHNRHGIGNEADLKQREVTEKDILLIPYITQNYDRATLRLRNGQTPTITFKKKIDDEYLYVESVNKRKKQLVTTTMWIKKK